MPLPRSWFPVLFAAGASAALAQAPDAAAAPAAARLSAPVSFDPIFRVPIHTQQPDERLGAYGVWAAGDAYKASFHDGFVFYPALGESYPENLPLRWRTTRVTVGGEPLATATAPTHVRSDWRYEYHHGDVVEAYDVRPDGVEQTFVIARRPAAAGELVVEGAVTTPLHAEPAAAAQQELVFHDANGNPIVSYGKAMAFDAAGRRTPVTTAFADGTVRLVVPADWLHAATFPVTVDPLTSATAYVTQIGSVARDLSVHREDESPVDNTMVALVRPSSASDFDVFAYLGNSALTSRMLVFTDVASGWSSLMPDVAFVGGVDRWIVGYWRHTPAENRVRAYFHDKGSLSHNSGVVASNHNPGTEHASFPAVGGNGHPTNGTLGLMVYRVDAYYGNSPNSKIIGVELNAQTRLFGPSRIVAGHFGDAESPDINVQRGWGENGWLVVYQERVSANDDYDVYAIGVGDMSTQVIGPTPVGPGSMGDKVRPVVQGWDGRFLVAMLQDVTQEINGQHFGRNVLTARVDWPALTVPPQAFAHRTVASSPNQDLTQLELGFDGITQSHWCLTFDRDVFTTVASSLLRLGHTGAPTELVDIGANRYHATSTWNGVTREFQVLSCAADPNGTVRAQLLQHSGSAWHLVYGTGCGPGVITSDTVPYPGTEFYRVQLQNAPHQVAGALGFSTAAGAIDLGPLGAANCWSNLASIDVLLPIVTDPAGNATYSLKLPDAPLFVGDLYWQFLYLWPAAPTPFTIGTTRGMRASVR